MAVVKQKKQKANDTKFDTKLNRQTLATGYRHLNPGICAEVNPRCCRKRDCRAHSLYSVGDCSPNFFTRTASASCNHLSLNCAMTVSIMLASILCCSNSCRNAIGPLPADTRIRPSCAAKRASDWCPNFTSSLTNSADCPSWSNRASFRDSSDLLCSLRARYW